MAAGLSRPSIIGMTVDFLRSTQRLIQPALKALRLLDVHIRDRREDEAVPLPAQNMIAPQIFACAGLEFASLIGASQFLALSPEKFMSFRMSDPV
jgi:hypothetical protein